MVASKNESGKLRHIAVALAVPDQSPLGLCPGIPLSQKTAVVFPLEGDGVFLGLPVFGEVER